MTLILITCQQQGRPFDYYYVKVFQRQIFAIFMPQQGSFAMKIPPPPPNENPPSLQCYHMYQSVSYTCYTQVKVHTECTSTSLTSNK